MNQNIKLLIGITIVIIGNSMIQFGADYTDYIPLVGCMVNGALVGVLIGTSRK